MLPNERVEALKAIERHLAMNRQERRQAGIATPRRVIEVARDELLPYVEHRMSTTEALPRELPGVGPPD